MRECKCNYASNVTSCNEEPCIITHLECLSKLSYLLKYSPVMSRLLLCHHTLTIRLTLARHLSTIYYDSGKQSRSETSIRALVTEISFNVTVNLWTKTRQPIKELKTHDWKLSYFASNTMLQTIYPPQQRLRSQLDQHQQQIVMVMVKAS